MVGDDAKIGAGDLRARPHALQRFVYVKPPSLNEFTAVLWCSLSVLTDKCGAGKTTKL